MLTPDDVIPLRRIAVNVGVDVKGQILQQVHIATEQKRIWVVPGKFLTIWVISGSGEVTVAETPMPAMGWEYVRLRE